MKKLSVVIVVALSTVLVSAVGGCGGAETGTTSNGTTSTVVDTTATGSSRPESTTSSATTSTKVSTTVTEALLPEVSDAEVDDLIRRLEAREDSDLELYRTISGTGDQESIELPLHPNTPLLVHFAGEGDEGHQFSIMGVDYTNGFVSFLVSSPKAVDGYAPLDWYAGADTFELSVSAIGPWTMEILPLDAMKRVRTPGKIQGQCNYVVWVEGSPSALRIKGDGGGMQFRVEMHTEKGVAVLADATGVFDERVKVSGGGVLVISADEPWSITVED